MRAIRIHTTGSPDVMVFEEAPPPRPGEGEVLIRVYAAGVNPMDCKMRLGTLTSEAGLPLILGRDVSGVIDVCGPGVVDWRPGDAVFGMLARHGGGYAEYAIAAADEIARKPLNVDHVHAAAVPVAALTAWQGLFDHGKLVSGETVLIHGAGGGVGHFAVQLARGAGARVVATAGPEDLNLVNSLGADIVIDFGAMPFQRVVQDVDLVLDLVAGPTQKQSWSVLKPDGRLVSALGTPRPDESAPEDARGIGFTVRPDRIQLAHIAGLLAEGRLSVVVTRDLPLAQARRAHDLLETRHTQGKTVLRVA